MLEVVAEMPEALPPIGTVTGAGSVWLPLVGLTSTIT